MNRLPSALVARTVRGRGRIVLFLVATVVLSTFGGAAFGYWSTSGSGAGSARTGTLNAPTGVTASNTAGSGSVSVGWSATTGTPGAQGYYIKRTPSGGGTSAFACGTSASSLKTTGSCTDSGVPDGTYIYAVTAVYNSWTATSAPSGSVTVSNSIGTTTTLTSSSNPSVVGQQVTYTATVTPASGSTSPSGVVTFNDGSSSITCSGGNQTLSAGSAACSVTYTTPGTHSITATYAGSVGFAGSSSSALSQTVGKAATTTTRLTASPNPSTTNQTVTYTATVDATASGSATPTGSVTFWDSGTGIACSGGTQTLNSSRQATCQVAYPAAGDHTIMAVYGGDSNFGGSTSASLTQTVQPPAAVSTTTVLTSSQNPAKSGTSVTYTATVKDGSGSPITTGTLSFRDSGTVITGCEAKPVNGSGQATCAQTYTDKGSHDIVVVYSGATGYGGSTSDKLSQRIVNSQVAGLAFGTVQVNGTTAALTGCSGLNTANVSCNVSAKSNASTLTATFTFVNSSGQQMAYSVDPTTLTMSYLNQATSPAATTSVATAGNASVSSTASATQSGNSQLTMKATLSDGVNTFTATLLMK